MLTGASKLFRAVDKLSPGKREREMNNKRRNGVDRRGVTALQGDRAEKTTYTASLARLARCWL